MKRPYNAKKRQIRYREIAEAWAVEVDRRKRMAKAADMDASREKDAKAATMAVARFRRLAAKAGSPYARSRRLLPLVIRAACDAIFGTGTQEAFSVVVSATPHYCSREDRDAVIWLAWQGSTVAAIAGAIGLPVSTVDHVLATAYRDRVIHVVGNDWGSAYVIRHGARVNLADLGETERQWIELSPVIKRDPWQAC